MSISDTPQQFTFPLLSLHLNVFPDLLDVVLKGDSAEEMAIEGISNAIPDSIPNFMTTFLENDDLLTHLFKFVQNCDRPNLTLVS